MRRRTLTIAGVTVGLVVTGLLVAASIWPVVNVVETGATPEYPDLRPQYYTAEPERVFDACKDTVVSGDGWELVAAQGGKMRLEAVRETALLGLTYDVTVWVEAVTQYATRVRVKSASRIGAGDFGQNARNIRTFFDQLDERLGARRFEPGELGKQKAER